MVGPSFLVSTNLSSSPRLSSMSLPRSGSIDFLARPYPPESQHRLHNPYYGSDFTFPTTRRPSLTSSPSRAGTFDLFPQNNRRQSISSKRPLSDITESPSPVVDRDDAASAEQASDPTHLHPDLFASMVGSNRQRTYSIDAGTSRNARD